MYTKNGRKSLVNIGQVNALMRAKTITTITAVFQLVTVKPKLAFAIKRKPIISPTKIIILLPIFSLVDVCSGVTGS